MGCLMGSEMESFNGESNGECNGKFLWLVLMGIFMVSLNGQCYEQYSGECNGSVVNSTAGSVTVV